jgi:hypothetical protein
MDERRSEDPAGTGPADNMPTERFPPVAPISTPGQPPLTVSPPAMSDEPGMSTPPPPPTAGWVPAQPTSVPPTSPPVGAPTGWVGPQTTPAAQWTPAAAQPGMMPAGAVYVREGGVTGLAKLGSLILIIFGLLFTLAGAVLLVIGREFETATIDPGLEQYRDLVGGLASGIGIVILVVAIIEILIGIFAWRGSGFARFIGIIYGILFGLVGLAGIAGAGTTTNPPTTTGSNSIVPAAIIAVAYLYVAAVFIFRYRSRPS